MFYFTLAGYLAAAACAGIAWGLFKANGRHREKIADLEAQNKNLRDGIKDRDRAIKEIQEAHNDAAKKKKNLHSGDADADFKHSIDIMRDVPGESDAD